MTFKKAIALPLIAVSLTISAGCLAKPSPQGYLKTQAAAQTDHTHAKSSKTTSQRYLKPGAAIRYEHNLPADIKPGETVVFQLVLNESYDSGNMSVDIQSEGDVQVFPSSRYANFDMSTGREHVMDVSVTVGSHGRHYLNVFAQATDGSGQSMPRIFSIPVQCGPKKALQPHSKLTATPSGENIIVMDAEEVIR